MFIVEKSLKLIPALALLVFGVVASSEALADKVGVNISNHTVAGNYSVDMGQGLFVGGGLLHEEDAGQVGSIDFIMSDDLRSGEHSFTAGVGGKLAAIVTEADGGDGGSMALGGFVDYRIPNMQAISIYGEVFYGPSVTSMNHVDGLLWYSASVEVELIDRAKIHFAYRKIEVDHELGGDFDMDEGLHGGIKLEF